VLKRPDDGESIGCTFRSASWPPTIETVAKDSVAELFGVRAGDQLTEIHLRESGAHVVRNHEHAQEMFDNLTPGELCMVTLARRKAPTAPSSNDNVALRSSAEDARYSARLDRARTAIQQRSSRHTGSESAAPALGAPAPVLAC
jgi:hypothetical protein